MTKQLLYDQQEGEEIKLLLRRHWMYFVGPIIAMFFLVFLPVLFYLISQQMWPLILEKPHTNALWLLVVLYYLFLWLYFFTIWTDYYLDIWVVTNKRILDIEQHGLFNREISEFKLFRIQDVTVEVRGVLPTLLNYGDVHIQTAGEDRKFIFKQVPNPNNAKNIILDLHSKSYQEIAQLK